MKSNLRSVGEPVVSDAARHPSLHLLAAYLSSTRTSKGQGYGVTEHVVWPACGFVRSGMVAELALPLPLLLMTRSAAPLDKQHGTGAAALAGRPTNLQPLTLSNSKSSSNGLRIRGFVGMGFATLQARDDQHRRPLCQCSCKQSCMLANMHANACRQKQRLTEGTLSGHSTLVNLFRTLVRVPARIRARSRQLPGIRARGLAQARPGLHAAAHQADAECFTLGGA